MNKKGFAISGLVYSILILFLVLISGILGILGSRKLILDKMKNNVIGNLNDEPLAEVYKDESGANYPRLVNKMIPVVYDDSINKWVYADIYEKWYDYDEKMWANAVILKDNIIKSVGQSIDEEEIALMYVWIPRFKYTLFNVNGENIEEQEIQVTFENKTNSTGTVKCVDAINQTDSDGNVISEICTDLTNENIINNVSTYTHPAFTFGDEQLEGFWVGKFENSTTDSECLNDASNDTCDKDTHIIEIKANSDSLRYINIFNMFTSIQNITSNYGINADSHMIKNLEWGAIAYLTNSKYGRCNNGLCEEVTINNVKKNETNNTTQTGCAGNGVSSEVSVTCQNEYNTNGVKASTTGNIYGVYDMSGGAWEYVMGVMHDGYANSSLYNLDSKYYDLYTYDTTDISYSRGKLGDATKEVNNATYVSWYQDGANFPNLTSNWFLRSSGYDTSTLAGLFYYGRQDGNAYEFYTSRSILIKR